MNQTSFKQIKVNIMQFLNTTLRGETGTTALRSALSDIAYSELLRQAATQVI